MADLTKIKVNGVDYNIKDPNALRDAPIDGKQYARQDGEWTEVQGGGESALPMSPYLNKKIGFLGDSNTTPNPSHTNKKYDVWVADLIGCNRLNYGRDGTGFAENGSGYDAYTFAKRVIGIDAECETVCVLGGINDVMRSTLGQFGDTSADTVYGGLEILCTNLKTRFPTADIVFITPPSATGLTGDNAYQVATAIKEVANQRGIHVFDFRQYINNPDFNDIHYTSEGHEILGKALADYLVRLKHYAGYRYIRTNSIPATSITLSENSISISGIGTHTLTATVTPVDTTDTVSWTSSNSGVAIVSNGVVTSVANGTATITATCGEFSATCTVAVSGIEIEVPVTGVTLNASSGEVEKDGTITLTATVEPANATNKNVTWSTSDATKATVNNGVVTGVAAGSATITVTTVDGGFTATYAVTVTDSQEHDGEQVIPDFAAINYDFSQVTKKTNAWYLGVASDYSQFQHTGYLGIKAGSYTLYTGAAIAANLFDTNFEYKSELNNGQATFKNKTFTIDYDGYIGVNLDCQNHSADDWAQVSLVKNS